MAAACVTGVGGTASPPVKERHGDVVAGWTVENGMFHRVMLRSIRYDGDCGSLTENKVAQLQWLASLAKVPFGKAPALTAGTLLCVTEVKFAE